jgi:hypothetical protein
MTVLIHTPGSTPDDHSPLVLPVLELPVSPAESVDGVHVGCEPGLPGGAGVDVSDGSVEMGVVGGVDMHVGGVVVVPLGRVALFVGV